MEGLHGRVRPWWPNTYEVWKEYLQESPPLPDLPQQVLDTYAYVSPPPLAELCPVDFAMRPWESFKQEMDGWLESQPLDESRVVDGPYPTGNFRTTLRGMLALSGESHGVCLASLCCIPDAVHISGEPDPEQRFNNICLVGTMAWDLDERTNLEIEVARLYSYIVLTNCYFGLVSCYTKTFACKRLPGLDGCVFVSPAVHYKSGDALKACAFVTWQGQNFDLAKAQAWYVEYVSTLLVPQQLRSNFFSSSGPRQFDRGTILARLWKLGREMCVANMQELVEKLAWWDDLSALGGDMRLVSQGLARNTASASYDGGKQVVVKFRDLSNSKGLDTDSMLRKLLREVDVYMRLRKLQGDVVPQLLEYGFVRGATVCFVVTSDHGRELRTMTPAMRLRRGRATLPSEENILKSRLHRVHALGVHFGGLPFRLLGGPFVFLKMSRAFVDGDRGGMAKDMEDVETSCRDGLEL